MMPGAPYVPLWCKSHFSFLEGASHPEELVETAEGLGIERIALTDRDGIHGVVEAHVAARERGLRLIIGSEITLEDGSSIVLLAQDRAGYSRLCHLITRGRRRSVKGESVVTWEEVCQHSCGILALWGGSGSLLVGAVSPDGVVGDLRDAFGERLFAVAARHRRAREVEEEARLRARADRHGVPVVAASEVLYHRTSRRDLQDVLACVRHGVSLSGAGQRIRGNAEHALRSVQAFERLFVDDPAAVARTREIGAACTFSLDEIRYRYPSEKLPDGRSSSEWLRQLTFRGAGERSRARGDSGEISAAMRAQLEKELDLIDELDYCGYFLTMWEIVRFCDDQGILCQGRGSAANSAVCYCLGITAVDPVRMGLLFERFLSRERAEPPDIDLDIEHERREEVIQHVYAKYGRDHAAMVANIIRYRARSAVRDVGKVLGMAETALDRLSKMLSPCSELTPEALVRAGLDPELPAHQHLLRLVAELIDVPRHLSIHPGGFLLGHEPVTNLVPIENAAMPDRTVIQWDKDSLEELGLFKVDLLGLGALRHLHLGFDLLREHYAEDFQARGIEPAEIGMATIPPGDGETFDRICASDTVGVFQIESRAQMAMLPRLRPRTYYDLVIEVSIVRPGPITGGMVHPYLRRRAGEEPVVYPHECLRPVLAKTLGVPLFQEQVIRLAMVAADYTPGEADQLRRDMAAWRKTGRIERHRERLVRRMMEKGIAREFAERVFEQIRGFGEYGFPESHAASFALIAYASAWLKCHYPDVFACSLLNALPMGFYSAATIIEDARRHDVEIRSIDVSFSEWTCTLETREGEPGVLAVRVGARFLKGMRRDDWERVCKARRECPFESPVDLVRRGGIGEGALGRLAQAGALESLEEKRRSALWQVQGEVRAPSPGSDGGREPGDEMTLPVEETPASFASLDVFGSVVWDYDAMGLSARTHPLAPLREALARQGLPDARTLNTRPDGSRVRYAGLVICRQRPGTASGVVFMTLEDESGFVNLVIWSRVFEKHTVIVKTASFLGVTGRLQVKDGAAHVIAEKFWEPQAKAGERESARPGGAGSRDFR